MSAMRDALQRLVDICYREGSSRSYLLCIGCDTECLRGVEYDPRQRHSVECPVREAELILEDKEQV